MIADYGRRRPGVDSRRGRYVLFGSSSRAVVGSMGKEVKLLDLYRHSATHIHSMVFIYVRGKLLLRCKCLGK
jgi:hypothetical protein